MSQKGEKSSRKSNKITKNEKKAKFEEEIRKRAIEEAAIKAENERIYEAGLKADIVRMEARIAKRVVERAAREKAVARRRNQ